MDKNQEVVEEQIWPPDIRIMAKWALLFGSLFLASWVMECIYAYDGLINKQNFLLGNDFANYWSAARLTIDHRQMTLFDLAGYHKAQEILFNHELAQFYNWSYPPSLIPWIVWLGLFPYPVALVLWLVGTYALYAFAVSYKRPSPWKLVLVLALAPSSIINIITGQNGFLSAALLVGGARLLSARPKIAGILFGFLTFKPQLGLLVPIAILIQRKWRVFIIAVLTIFTLLSISFLLFGLKPWQAYFNIVPHFQKSYLESFSGPNLTGGYMMLSFFRSMRILGGSLPVAYSIQAIAALTAVLSVIYAFVRSQSHELRNAVLLTATFLVSPYIFFYDTTILSAGVVSTVIALGPRMKAYHLPLFAMAWYLPSFVFLLNSKGFPLYPLIIVALLLAQLHLISVNRKEETNSLIHEGS